MATRLSDLPIVAEVATKNIILSSLAVNAFVNSGVMSRDAELDSFLSSNLGGKTVSPRYIGPLALEDANISSDDPANKSTPGKISGGANKAVRQSLNKSWSSMDLNAALLGDDPIGAITSQIGEYWSGVQTMRLLASLKGVIAADQAGDKVLAVDISGESGKDALFNGDAFIDALGTMGDRASSLVAIAMHSVVYNTMLKEQLIDTVRDADGNVRYSAYMGKRIIVDDAMTAVTSGSSASYYTYLFGAGAVALGVGSPKVPFEIERDAASGNGGGEEAVYSRTEWIIHPQGFSFGLDTTPTIAELETAANWTRNYERKRIPLAALISQG